MEGLSKLGRRPSERPLRIAMVGTPWYEMPPGGYGGIEAMVTDLIEGLVGLGHEVVLFGAGANGTAATEYYCTYEEPPNHRVGDRWPELVHATAVQQKLAELRVDLVHDHSAAGPMMASSRDIPTVVTTHGPLDGLPGSDNADIGRYYRQLSGDVSFVAISDAQQTLAPELSWAGTVHNAIRVDDFPLVERKDNFLLFLGRMKSYKGAHHAIDAARAVGMRIVLAGKCCEEEELRYFADEISPRLGDDVDWLGEITTKQKIDLLGRAQALLFPITWNEPFGLVMIEAMASGTPVVALRAGSVPEVVAQGVSGIVVDEPSQLPDAIRASAQLSPAACRDHVVRNFDTAAMARGYEAIFARLVGDAGVLRSTGTSAAATLRSGFDGAAPTLRLNNAGVREVSGDGTAGSRTA